MKRRRNNLTPAWLDEARVDDLAELEISQIAALLDEVSEAETIQRHRHELISQGLRLNTARSKTPNAGPTARPSVESPFSTAAFGSPSICPSASIGIRPNSERRSR